MNKLCSAIVTSDQRMVWAVMPLLGKLGISSEVHSVAAKALDSLRRKPCDLLIVDCSVAESIAFLRQLRALPQNGRAVVVAFAANYRAAEQLRDATADFTCDRSLPLDAFGAVLQRAKGQVTGEKRVQPRTSVGQPVYLQYSFDGVRFCQGVIVDLSTGGVCIEALEGLQAGRTVSVQFNLPAMRTPINAVGEITWRSHSGRAGIRFTQITESSLRQIERWLEAANRPFETTMGLTPRRTAAAWGW